VLRGNYAAKIDDKGRLKIPTAFRVLIEEKYGSSLFMTSYSRDPMNKLAVQVFGEDMVDVMVDIRMGREQMQRDRRY